MILAYRYRVKSLTGLLNSQAHAVNYVWNYCNDVQKQALKMESQMAYRFRLQQTDGAVMAGVGIDLGLKSLAALSNGERVENPRHYRRLEAQLGIAQRARKRGRVTALHTSIRNARWDHLHKLSTRIVLEFDYIAVGNVSAAGLAKTSMAKSVLDAGWSSFRSMLAYKALRHGAWYQEVDESFSSQVCSSCGTLPDSRPRGIADLGIRQWICSDCGAEHDRDINAALNILARSGHRAPVEGIPASRGGCQ